MAVARGLSSYLARPSNVNIGRAQVESSAFFKI